MFDPWIIEEIRRREEERARKELEQPVLEIREPTEPGAARPHKDEDRRGVVIIDLGP